MVQTYSASIFQTLTGQALQLTRKLLIFWQILKNSHSTYWYSRILEQYHSPVTALAESMAEERTDCVYIRDLTGVNESVTTAVDEASGIDSSYSATYFPWVKVRDIGSNKDIYVPPSVIVPQAYVYNDNVAAEWFAPAGINRGSLGGAIDTRYRLYKADRDNLHCGTPEFLPGGGHRFNAKDITFCYPGVTF